MIVWHVQTSRGTCQGGMHVKNAVHVHYPTREGTLDFLPKTLERNLHNLQCSFQSEMSQSMWNLGLIHPPYPGKICWLHGSGKSAGSGHQTSIWSYHFFDVGPKIDQLGMQSYPALHQYIIHQKVSEGVPPVQLSNKRHVVYRFPLLSLSCTNAK